MIRKRKKDKIFQNDPGIWGKDEEHWKDIKLNTGDHQDSTQRTPQN